MNGGRGLTTALGVLALLAGSWLGVAPHAAAQDLVDAGEETSIVLPATVDAVVLVPITPVGAVSVGDLRVSVVRVLRDGRPVPATMSRAVSVTVDSMASALKLTVDVDALDRTGEYGVTTAVTAGVQRQLVELTLRREPGAVTAPAVVEVVRTVFFPELNRCLFFCSAKQPELRIVAGADTRITTLSAFGVDIGPGAVVVDPFGGASPSRLAVPLTDGGSLKAGLPRRR